MNDIDNTQPQNPPYAGLFRRLFAILYDSFLLIAVFFVVTIIATALNNGNAIEPGDFIYPLYVFIIFGLSYFYFAWFWMQSGQTLGMKTWYIQIKSEGSCITWADTATRFVIAIVSWGAFGLGFLWTLVDKKNRSWHDLASKTVLIDIKARNKKI